MQQRLGVNFEIVYTMSSSNIKYGFGAAHEVGYDMKSLGATKDILRFQNQIISLFFLATVFQLSGCGISIPEDKADYIGLWQGPNMVLLIEPEGKIYYKRVRGRAETKINASI